MKKPDSLIFDMDGTLWDAGDTYLQAWNDGAKMEKLNREFTRAELDYVMGWERAKVLEHFFPNDSLEERERIYSTINSRRMEIIRELGGVLYDGVRERIPLLASDYKLFIVSNCPKGMIQEFLQWSGLGPYFTDEFAHGVNSMPKHHNINLLIQKHGLESPVYIGDTEVDMVESRKAGIPFVFVSYGFGKCEDYDLKFDSFVDFTDHFLSLAK